MNTPLVLAASNVFDAMVTPGLILMLAVAFLVVVRVMASRYKKIDLTSSDIWFNLELTAQPALQRNNPPVIALTAPTSGAVFFIPGTITLAATASDPDGAVAQVEFFAGPTRIGAATNSPYSLDWTAPAPGVYTLTAVATDNEGAVTVSAPATITLYGMTASRWTAFNPARDTLIVNHCKLWLPLGSREIVPDVGAVLPEMRRIIGEKGYGAGHAFFLETARKQGWDGKLVWTDRSLVPMTSGRGSTPNCPSPGRAANS